MVVSLFIIIFTFFLFLGKISLIVFLASKAFPLHFYYESISSLFLYSFLMVLFPLFLIIIGYIFELFLAFFQKNINSDVLAKVITISLFAVYLFIMEHLVKGVSMSPFAIAIIGLTCILLFIRVEMISKRI
ncbi:hypothetical protein J2S74_003730 [Evansella vedderi]|uniref:Uncharacterized protein n=1 Tax=Evansella vedderi TaxID=38282 RepID=A0ABT9ZZC1_9BACI|nr:hypothetical protein [Evansella vedderi]MDQ0256310.1 hypothetical protein [Evansella vedderi]